MISFGNAASSHSGLIPLKTAYKKRGELLWAIASKKNFINLHSATFVTVFARNLVHGHKFRIFQKTARWIFWQIWQSRNQLSINIPCKFQEHWKQRRFLNRASNITNFSPDFVFTSERPRYSLALFSSFICTCTLARRYNLRQKGPSVKSPEYANNRVKKLEIYYNITATHCKSFCDVITRVR